MTDTVHLLRDLVALPSVNPAFLPKRHPHAGEQHVVDFLKQTAAAAGLDVQTQPVFSRRSNLLARLTPPAPPRKRILLAPHTDTVGVANEDQFSPRIKNGRLHGRGACDTKGSIAAMLSALCALAKSAGRPRETEIIFAALVDEENGQAGSRALVAAGFKADLAIVGEPTQLQVVTAHKGNLWLQFDTRGKAAHGARPELGKNAVHEMARIVDLLQTTCAAQLRRRRHPLLGSPTISVGMMSGGTQANIVPDHATMCADRRTIPGETRARVIAEIRALLKTRNLSASISDNKAGDCLPLETNIDLPLVRAFLKSMRQKGPLGVDYFCDAGVLSQGGIPSVVFGPGDIAQAHTANEFISLRSLEQAQARLLRFLKTLP